MVFEAADVVWLQRLLADAGVSWCIVGGWGVDALLGEETRSHKDLDVLIDRACLQLALDVLIAAGFRPSYVWEENRPMSGDGSCAGRDSAFVMADSEGREVDVHVYESVGTRVRPLWNTDHYLASGDLAAVGVIAGVTVRCMTSQKQLETHRGYDLPEAQKGDVSYLEALLRDERSATADPNACRRGAADGRHGSA
ncbi:MAG: nucleotidyltransferase domain-containing protein [Acidothermaceae bacterium]